VRISRVGGRVEQFRPAGVVAREILVLRRHRDRLIADRIQRAACIGAKCDPLDGRGPVAQPVHLVAGEHETHRTFEPERTEHGQHHLILRAQSGAERAADERRYHADIVRLEPEHAADIALHVLHALCLVVDRELAAVEDNGRGEQLHRIVILGGNEILALVPRRRFFKSPRGVAARLLRLFDRSSLFQARMQIGRKAFRFVLDIHERCRKTCGLPVLREHQRDRLSVEPDPVVIERAKRRAAFRRDVVVIILVGRSHLRPVVMGQHVEHARNRQRPDRIDACDAALGHGRGHDRAKSEIGHIEFAGVFGEAGDLGASVDAGGRSTDGGGHDVHRSFVHRIFLLD